MEPQNEGKNPEFTSQKCMRLELVEEVFFFSVKDPHRFTLQCGWWPHQIILCSWIQQKGNLHAFEPRIVKLLKASRLLTHKT